MNEVRNILTQGTYNDPDNLGINRGAVYGEIPIPVMVDIIFNVFMKGTRDMDSAKVHELKTDPEAYNEMVEGHKTHTVRLDDRTYIEGDYIIFRKTKYTGQQMKDKGNDYPLIYSGLSTLCKITHVHEGPGMAEGWVACSIKILDRYPGRVQ